MKKSIFESLKFFCAAILCVILSAFSTPAHADNPCRNLANLNDTTYAAQYWTVDTSTGTISTEQADANFSFWIRNAKAGEQYIMSADVTAVSGGGMQFQVRDSSNQVLSAMGGAGTVGLAVSTAYTIPSDGDYRFNLRTNGSAAFTVTDIQIEKGSTATAYTPYDPQCATCDGTIVNYTSATGTVSQSGTPTPTNPIEPTFYKQGNMVLRAIGSYKDSYDATTGKITRRVGVAVLDGTEDWRAHNSIAGWFQLPEPLVYGGIAPALCTHYPYSSSQGGAGVYFSTGRSSPQTNRIVIADDINFPRTGMLAEFKQYLAQQYAAGTPVTIYYPLETETTEDWPASYCETPIKIATTKYNESAFGPLNTALANAISVVDTVVSNTITQAASIATLQAQKQTRPADDLSDANNAENCPAYKQCLLVEDEQGVPHWYEITDPFRDFVAPIIAQGISPTDTVAVFDAGYTQLEYIESTGTQWIDTGVTTPASNSTVTKFEANVAYVSSAANQRNFIAGYKDYTHGHYCEFRNDKFGFSNGSIGYYSPTLTAETPYDVTMQINGSNNVQLGINIGGTDYTKSFTQYQGDTMGQFVLFMLDSSYISKGLRMYSAKLTINNTLVRNFVPVRNNATGKYGMYDTVSRQFYGNAASSGDDFTAGPVVANGADVPVPQWIRAWDANAQYNLSAGEVYGTAQCNNLSGTEHAQKATSAQMASSGWSENGAKCWCKVVGINVDNEYTEAPATASWVFDAVRPSVEDCNKMCAAACSNRVLGEAAFRKALFGD